MTLPSTPRRAGPYVGNLVTTSFPFGFKAFSPGDITVVRRIGDSETILTYGVNYAVTLNADQDQFPGGYVLYPIGDDPMPASESITILSAIPYNQQTKLPSGGQFRPSVIEAAFDRIVAQIQQLAEQNARQVGLPASYQNASEIKLPFPQSGKLLAWNNGGNGLVNVDADVLVNVAGFAAWHTQSFAGGGTTFALSSEPASVKSLLVAVDGLLLDGDMGEFSVSGAVLSIPGGTPAESRVFVRWGETLPESNFDSDNVSYRDGYTVEDALDIATKNVANVKDKRFAGGAKGDNATDDTAAFAAARAAVVAAGGGTIYVPEGIYRVDGLAWTYAASIPVRMVGAGKGNTYLRRRAGSNLPVISIDATGVLDIYGGLSELTIDGINRGGDGLFIKNAARFSLNRVAILSCDAGIEAEGALIFRAEDCSINGNAVGSRLRKSTVPIYSNLIEFVGGEARGNNVAFDIGDANAVVLRGVDISGNGLTGNLSTGGVIVRSTIDDEMGYGSVELDGCWFESNFGWAFQAENASDGQIIFNRGVFGGNEAGRDISIGTVRWSVLRDVIAPSPGNSVTIASINSIVEGGIIANLNDSSTNKWHNTVTSAGASVNRTTQVSIMGSAGNELLIADASVATGGSANDSVIHKYGSGTIMFSIGGTLPLQIQGGKLGFYGTSPISKPTVNGAKGGNAALASLITQLAALGIITDSTT